MKLFSEKNQAPNFRPEPDPHQTSSRLRALTQDSTFVAISRGAIPDVQPHAASSSGRSPTVLARASDGARTKRAALRLKPHHQPRRLAPRSEEQAGLGTMNELHY